MLRSGPAFPSNAEIGVGSRVHRSHQYRIRKAWGPYTVAGGATIDLDFELALMSGAKRALNTPPVCVR
jgi:hypothetical protein